MTAYVGEVRMFAGNFPPNGWAFCDGQLLPISENDVLFQLIGTTYGGDGQSTFGLPNLQSRVPMHMGTGPDGITYQMSEAAGVESVTLNTQQIPAHSHAFTVSLNAGSASSPLGAMPAASSSADLYLESSASGLNFANQAITPAGGSQPHENCQPFLCINFIISLFGVFPSPT
jgi:microcystin-dependent protein